MARPGKAVAVACIALVVVAAILPLGGISLDWIVVPAAFVLLEMPGSTGAFSASVRCAAPRFPYFRSIDSRGPPSASLA